MKRFFNLSVFASVVLSLFVLGCANSLEENSSGAVQGTGYIRVGTSETENLDTENKKNRALDYETLGTAQVKIYYQQELKLCSTAAVYVPISSEGKGTFTIENIPTGNNRVVEVKSQVSGAVLYALIDQIKEGDNGIITVNWDSTPLGSVYYNLIKARTDISEYGNTEKESYSEKIESLIKTHNVHPSLIDAQAIALGTSDSDFILGYGTVKVTASGCSGYSYQITDIATKKQSVSSSSYSAELKATPGTWCLWVFDSTGAKVETKTIAVAEDAETSVKLSYEEAVTGKIVLHVPTSLGYSYIWAWNPSEDSDNYTGGTWPGKSMTQNGSYYDYTLEKTAAKVIFNKNSGSAVGTAQTNDLYITEGEWEYIGGSSGTKDTNGSSISSNFKALSGEGLTVDIENPAVPLPPTVSINYSEGDDVSLSGSITFTVTSENTELTSGTYKFGTKSGTLTAGTTTVKLSAAGITSEGEFSVTASVTNAKGTDSLSVKLNASDTTSTVPTRLGAYYTKKATSFSIWSPDSSTVTVEVTPVGGETTSYTCEKGFTVNGDYPDSSNIYGVTVPGNLHLAEYQFKIGGVAVRDPYGKMIKYDGNQQKTNVLCNNTAFYTGGPTGSSWAGPSVNIVVDMSLTEPTDGWATRPVLEKRTDAVVYEVHVGDFTSSSTWSGTEDYRGKFPGMVETGTTYTSGTTTVKTGLDHLKELGVTHVQIMPMYDFATKYVDKTGEIYNWGYDPVNYNVPEDRYSTCPGDYVERIREVKEMVNEFHKNGIRVVMDVVYNHTFANEMFENISSKYYTATDLSGCGNSVDVSNSMVSRMVRDSLEYWAEEYNIDGFRFDLMAIFTKAALKDWGEYLNNTNEETKDRNLLMQGEPWQCNNNSSTDYGYASAISELSNAHIGCFAGKWRETLKGSSDDGKTLGYIFSGKTDKDGDSTYWNTTVGLRGSGTGLGSDSEGVWTRYFTANPEQAVNYLMAHDNLCFYDKIAAAGTNYTSYADAIVKFGHGILLSAQGIPFIHAGDEFLRTKAVGTFASEAHNSYMWGQEMNQIDWSYKAKYVDCFNYHKDMIQFRKDNDALRNRNGVGSTTISGNVIYYTVTNSSSSPANANKTLTIVINPGSNLTLSGKGTMVMNKTGAVSSSDTTCEGTGVTIFAQ